MKHKKLIKIKKIISTFLCMSLIMSLCTVSFGDNNNCDLDSCLIDEENETIYENDDIQENIDNQIESDDIQECDDIQESDDFQEESDDIQGSDDFQLESEITQESDNNQESNIIQDENDKNINDANDGVLDENFDCEKIIEEEIDENIDTICEVSDNEIIKEDDEYLKYKGKFLTSENIQGMWDDCPYEVVDNVMTVHAGNDLHTQINIAYSDYGNLTKIIFDGDIKVTDGFRLFADCASLTSIDFGPNFDTSELDDMQAMFENLESMETLDLSKLNTSNVTDMDYMFECCYKLKNLKLGNMNTSKVESMGAMFYKCESITTLDLSMFDVTNVTYMENMFYGCLNLKSLNISSFVPQNVEDMDEMFYDCKSLENINFGNNFKTSNCSTMEQMFQNCESLKKADVLSFDTSNLYNMYAMFCNCKSLETVDLSGFNSQYEVSPYDMFRGCEKINNLDFRNFNVDTVNYAFEGCLNLTHIYLSESLASKINDTKLTGSWKNLDTGEIYEENESHETTIPAEAGEYVKGPYIIKFDKNDGTGATPSEIKIWTTELVPRPNNPTRSGYTFTGWMLNNKFFNFNVAPNSDIILVAKWQISGRGGGGGGSGGGGGGGGGGAPIYSNNGLILHPGIGTPSDLKIKTFTGLKEKINITSDAKFILWNKNSFYTTEIYIVFDSNNDKFINATNNSLITNDWVGTIDINGEVIWYYTDEKGDIVQAKLHNINDNTYCFDGDGKMLTSYVKINDNILYFNEIKGTDEGKLVINK